ncbi:solute carrier family 2, facilitated glucose transporter member 1-like isoform X2 [Zophobas morio]
MDTSTLNLLWGLTTSIMNVGGTIGGLIVGVTANKLGPKGGLFFNNFLVLVATIFMGIAKPITSLEVMIVGRFFIGINCGLNAGLCPMYLSEVSPVSLRGAVSSVYQLVITISILIAQIVGLHYVLGNHTYWPYIFILPIFFAIFQVITLLFCTESPRYLIGVKGNEQKAEQSLKFLRMSDDVSADMTLMKSEDAAVKALPKITLSDMYKTRQLRIPLIIAVVIMLAQQFSGINAVIFYSTDTFEKAGLKGDNPKYATIGIGVVNVLMTIVSLYLVEVAGRKTLLLIGFGGMAIDTLLLSLTLYFADQNDFLPWVCIILTFIYIILFAAGAGSIPWFLVTEIFNQAARPTAVSLAVPTNWIANFIVTLTFPSIEALIGPFVFLIFVALDVVFFLFILKFVPETKNRTIDDIISEWK